MNRLELWDRYRQYLCAVGSLGLEVDISRMPFDPAFLDSMADPMQKALAAMEAIELGAKANASEDRQVGHYWLRAPALAPNEAIRGDIEDVLDGIRSLAGDVHAGILQPQRGDGFYIVLVIGIGGSVLGPRLICDALGRNDDRMVVRFIDNTDPDGIDRVMGELEEVLAHTLTVVISKSGGTKETRNALLEVERIYERAGLDFAKHAVAITSEGSALHELAVGEGWLRTFPVWDFVGGRTSVTSAVGLVPAALQGVDFDAFLVGARDCDLVTRERDVLKNPAALLAMMWRFAGEGCGKRNMVMLPYCDRLSLLGMYLQQLVMESIGKEKDRDGNVVHQGLTVFGNKGSTDQHSLVQQLQEGPDDFFVTFINVLRSGDGPSTLVEEEVTTGDYLHAFWQGTREALSEAGRQSISITCHELSARTLGALIALFERAVGLYAELVNVNAYDQPGVEAGKAAAASVLDLQRKAFGHLRANSDSEMTPVEIAAAIGEPHAVEAIHHLLRHATTDPIHRIRRIEGATPLDTRYTG